MLKRVCVSALTKEQWRQVRYLIRFSQADWAALFGVTHRVVGRWESGDTPVPLMADHLLRFILSDDRIRVKLLSDSALYVALSEKGIL